MSTRSALAVSTLATHRAVSRDGLELEIEIGVETGIRVGAAGAVGAVGAVGARPLTPPEAGEWRRSRCVALTKPTPAVPTLANGPPPAGA